MGTADVRNRRRPDAGQLDPENTLYMDLKTGRVVIQLLPDLAPKMSRGSRRWRAQGFYDGTPFHRVIEGFMAQGGDPTGTGTGGSKLPNLPAGVHATSAHFLRGTVRHGAHRRPEQRATASSSSCSRRRPRLDGQYTIWGQVVQGMELCRPDQARQRPERQQCTNPDRIIQMRVAADPSLRLHAQA